MRSEELRYNSCVGGIYLFTFPNGKQYIGQTIDFYNRFKSYRGSVNSNKNENMIVVRAIKKYGWDNIEKNLLYVEEKDKINIDYLNDLEIHYIKELNTIKPFGYNMTFGGRGPLLTEETKKKISNTLKHKYENKDISVSNKIRVGVFFDGEMIFTADSILEASRKLGCAENTVGNRIRDEKAYKIPYKNHYTFKRLS